MDHFFVMVGQILDEARIGGLIVRLTFGDGGVVEGVPAAPASSDGAGEEIDDTGYRRWISVDGRTLDMTDVCEAAIVRPVKVA
jgi:hypothetical protein